jgi:hypothetical protein
VSWHKVTLTVSGIPAQELTTLRNKFFEIWIASGSPRGIGLFCDIEPQAQLDRQVGTQISFYFSPDALHLASSLVSDSTVAICCEPPDARRVIFVAGDEGCWELLE